MLYFIRYFPPPYDISIIHFGFKIRYILYDCIDWTDKKSIRTYITRRLIKNESKRTESKGI